MQIIRLLGYVRVSSDDQRRNGHSLDDQPERLAAWCQAYSSSEVRYELVGVISEQVSARKVPLADRKGGAELLARLGAGEADGVIVIKIDRLFRDLIDGLEYFREALYPRRHRKAHGRAAWQVVSLAEHIDTSTASGRHMLKFHLLEADAEADRTSERTANAIAGLRRRGKVFGHVPYGCIASGGDWSSDLGRMVNQSISRDPETWPLREQIVGWSREGVSLRRIAARLLSGAIAAPNGGREWSTSTLSELVKSHDSLAHLPLHGAEDARSEAAAPDQEFSVDAAQPAPAVQP